MASTDKQRDRHLDALVVDPDVVQLKPQSFHFDLWCHFGGGTGHFGGRQHRATFRHLKDRQAERHQAWNHMLSVISATFNLLSDCVAALTVIMELLKTSCCLAVSRAIRLRLFTLWSSSGSTHTTMIGCCTTSRFLPVTVMLRPPLRAGSHPFIRTLVPKTLIVCDK